MKWAEAVGDTVEYRVDRDNVIVAVNEPWRAFASANGAEDLVEAEGRNLIECITGASTRTVTGYLMDRVRQTQRTVEIPFRCDAPDRRRYMRLRLLPAGHGGVAFRSWIVREETRPLLAILDIGKPRDERRVRVCSWCKKVAVGDVWVEVEEASEHLGLFEEPSLPELTHGICDGCEKTLLTAV